jgi:hypothetical protein
MSTHLLTSAELETLHRADFLEFPAVCCGCCVFVQLQGGLAA